MIEVRNEIQNHELILLEAEVKSKTTTGSASKPFWSRSGYCVWCVREHIFMFSTESRVETPLVAKLVYIWRLRNLLSWRKLGNFEIQNLKTPFNFPFN